MTIVQPYKKISFRFILIACAGVFLGLFALLGIILYNQLVDARHDMARVEARVKDEEIANADLKNQLYALTDPVRPDDFLKNRGLVLDQNPRYSESPAVVAARP